jgi:hypothetical protein
MNTINHRFRCRRGAALALFLAAALLIHVDEAQALITGGFGNDPVSDHDWPAGSLELANLKTRVGWWEGPPFGGGQYTFLYRGDAQAFNEALDKLAAIKAPAVELEIHNGPEESFWLVDREADKQAKKEKRDPRVDWTFTVWTPRNFHHLYNNPRSLFSSGQEDFRRSVPAPKIDVYIGGGLIDWKSVNVPKNVRVVDRRRPDGNEKLKATIHGRVYHMLTSKPVANAEVSIVGYNDKREMATLASTTTNADGEFRLEELAGGGGMNIHVKAAGFAPRALGWQELGKGEDREVHTELSPAQVVSGRVIDSSNQPVPKAKLRTFTLLGVDGRGYEMPEPPTTTTNEQGIFSLELPQGFVQLSVYADGLYQRPPFSDIFDVPRDNIVLSMVRTSKVTVEVLDAGGKPVASTSVRLTQLPGGVGSYGSSGASDADGKATVEGIPPGEYRVTTDPTGESGGRVVTVEEGKPASVTIDKN